MDKAVELFDEGKTHSFGAVGDLSINWPSTTSVYGDDTALSIGTVSFSVPSAAGLKNWTGQVMTLANLVRWEPVFLTLVDSEIDFRVTGVQTSRGVSNVSGTFSLSATAPPSSGLNLDYNFAYAEISTVYVYPVVNFYDTSGDLVMSVIADQDLTLTCPVGTKFGLTPGNGLATLAGFAQAIGWVFVPGSALRQLIPFPTTVSGLRDYGDISLSLSEAQPASAVEVIRYAGGFEANVEILPHHQDTAIVQVGASETVVVDIPVEAWVTSVNQPTCIDFVEADPNYYDGTDGVYAVAGNDNRPIPATQWLAQGGAVQVEPHPSDPKSVRVTVVGASDTTYAPYRLAMTSGEFYSALRITADAIIGVPETITIPTGADPDIVLTDSVITIDNPSIQSLEQAYEVGTRAARKYTGLLASMSIQDGAQVALGVLHESEYRRYMVRSMTGDNTEVVNADAEALDMMEFFEEVWPDSEYTMGDFEAQWPNATMTMGDFMIEYLRNEQ